MSHIFLHTSLAPHRNIAILNEMQIPTPAAYHVAENHVYSEQKAWDLQRSHWTSGTVYHILKNEKYKGTYVGAKFIMPVPCKHRVLRAPLEQQVRIEDSHAAIVTPEEFEQAQMVIMLQHGKHQAGNYTKHQYPLKGKVYCGYCQKLMKYRVLKKLGPSFNCRFSATAVDSPCKRIPISEELLEEIVRNALTVQIKQAEHVLEILHERERKALICFSALERQEEKLSAEKAEIVKQRVALYEQYADGNMSKEEFIRQRDAYRVQEDERMEQIQRLRTEKNQIFQPVKKDTDNLQAVMDTVREAGDVMHLSQNVVETFIDRIMNIIVTGGAGFIGSNFVFHMLKKYPDYRIICLDKLTCAGNLSTLAPVMSGTLSFILQMNFTGSRSQSMFRAVQIGCIF